MSSASAPSPTTTNLRKAISSAAADARADQLTLVTTEKDFARLRGGAEPPAFGSEIAAFAVTLEFADADGMRKFLAKALFQARETRFQARS